MAAERADVEPVLCAGCGRATRDARVCAHCGAAPTLDGRYALTAVLGRGASGIVYAARRLADGAEVAIKEVVVGHSEASRAQAAREAAAFSSLEHPGIPRLLDRVAVEGRVPVHYLVLERVRGRSLRDALTQRRLDTAEVFQRLAEVLELAAHMHARGLVHRDLKLDHLVQRDDGSLALLDLGSASVTRAAPGDDHLTTTGTVGYMPLEQIAGVARRENDIYAIGALGIALLTGRDPVTLLDAHHRLVWADRVALAPAQRGWLEALLAPDADDRPSDAAALSVEARAMARLPPPAPARSRTRARSAALLGLLALALPVGALGVSAALTPTESPTRRPNEEPPRVAPPNPTWPSGSRAGVLPAAVPSVCRDSGTCRSLADFEGFEMLDASALEGGASVGRPSEVRVRGEHVVGGVSVPCDRRLVSVAGRVTSGVTCFHASGGRRPRTSAYLRYLRDTYGPERSATQVGGHASHRWRSGRHSLEVDVTRPAGCEEDACVRDLRTHYDAVRDPPSR